MPTEEVFTAPDFRRADGYVTSTKPLSYNGNIIEGIKVTFKDGQIVDISAKKGDQVMKDLVFENAGARALGECALVPDPSPISQSGITFFNTLFDENASNHLAIGAAYATSVWSRKLTLRLVKSWSAVAMTCSKNQLDFSYLSQKKV